MNPATNVASIFENATHHKPSYACPLCDEIQKGPFKIWDHFRKTHADRLNIFHDQEKEKETKDRLVNDALQSARDPSARNSLAARWPQMPKAEDTDDSPPRPPSVSRDSEEEKQLERLSLGQTNPLKRAAEIQTSEQGQTPRPGPPKSFHPKPFPSESPQILDQDYWKGLQKEKSWKQDAAFPSDKNIQEETLSSPSRRQSGPVQAPRHSGERQPFTNTGGHSKRKAEHRKRGSLPAGGNPGTFQVQPKRASKPAHVNINTNAANESTPNPNDMQIDTSPKPLRQPETRPISHDQLIVEVKAIYAGLVLVEAKCIEVDQKQSLLAQVKDLAQRRPLKDDQWQSLIALHKQLLHEHHDFFLASQHPSASHSLRKLAAKYSMPARMWRHGIHAFLEVLRHRLPESLEHMLTFIYIAYSMMALLYETISTFEDTWIECLGDLGRYRMAIEDDEPRDREVWSGVARHWYSKASDRNPAVGRLYHHLAILARPYTLEQLSFYTRALTCITPFTSAHGSIMTLFTPALAGKHAAFHRVHSLERLAVTAHAYLFKYPDRAEEYNKVLQEIMDGTLHQYIERGGEKFKQNGVFLVVSIISALFEFGALTEEDHQRSLLRRIYQQVKINRLKSKDLVGTEVSHEEVSDEKSQEGHNRDKLALPPLTDEEIKISESVLTQASNLAFPCFDIILDERHWKQGNTIAAIHVILIFVLSVVSIEDAMARFENRIPWVSICLYANYLASQPGALIDAVWLSDFPEAWATNGRPPPEDYIARGQLYTEEFFPEKWFIDAKVDEEERMLEQASHNQYRRLRILWLTARICSFDKWIQFDETTEKFMTLEYVGSNPIPSPGPLADSTSSGAETKARDVTQTSSLKNIDSIMTDVPNTYRKAQQEPKGSHPSDTSNFNPMDPPRFDSEGTKPKALTMKDADVSMTDSNLGKLQFTLGKQVVGNQDASWLKSPVKDPGTSPPKKEAVNVDDQSVKIFQGPDMLDDIDI